MAGLPVTRIVRSQRADPPAAPCLRQPAQAYIGPGAGFALLSSFFVLFTTIVVAHRVAARWPFRRAVAAACAAAGRRGRDPAARSSSGFDGQDPKLTDRFMAEGQLPNFEKLARDGLLPPAADDVPVGLAGRVVVVQHRDATRRGTTSSTSSTATGARTCRGCRRRASARSSASSGSDGSGFRSSGRSCGCCASRSRSGRFSASTASGARSCACRSRFRRTASTARS